MTTYRFTKNGKTYEAAGNNRFEAQTRIEIANRVKLGGAKFEEIWKLKVIRTGTVK